VFAELASLHQLFKGTRECIARLNQLSIRPLHTSLLEAFIQHSDRREQELCFATECPVLEGKPATCIAGRWVSTCGQQRPDYCLMTLPGSQV
jgi:hypothetical protein